MGLDISGLYPTKTITKKTLLETVTNNILIQNSIMYKNGVLPVYIKKGIKVG